MKAYHPAWGRAGSGENMRLLCTSLLVALLLIAAVPDAFAARPTTLRLSYQGATPLGAGAMRDECAANAPLRIGVVCLVVPTGAREMSFTVDDASSLAVGGTFYTYDALGELTAVGGHCGSGASPVAGGGTVVVRLELVNGPLYCASEGVAGGEATRGFVEFALK